MHDAQYDDLNGLYPCGPWNYIEIRRDLRSKENEHAQFNSRTIPCDQSVSLFVSALFRPAQHERLSTTAEKPTCSSESSGSDPPTAPTRPGRRKPRAASLPHRSLDASTGFSTDNTVPPPAKSRYRSLAYHQVSRQSIHAL